MTGRDTPGFKELIKADAKVFGFSNPSLAFYLLSLLGMNKFSAVLLFRIASTLHGMGRMGKALSSAVTRLNSILNGSELSPAARIGPGLNLPHPQGVVCGPITAGANLTIRQRVTLELQDPRLPYGTPAGYPTLGDNVTTAPGVAILGPVRIGDGVTIGAYSVVLNDIPAGSVATGNPARVIWRRRRKIAKAAPSQCANPLQETS
jgi:serine O-acetyltransferase